MFKNQITTGKHLIADIYDIKNIELLNNIDKIKEIFDEICHTYNFTILEKRQHIFTPQGCSVFYLLSESHISIHTFPECSYFAFDLYTCSNKNTDEIYTLLLNRFEANGNYTIISRGIKN